jgi:hypothetical protein
MGGDVMQIIKHNLQFKGDLRPRPTTDFIIFHHTESKKGSVEDIHNWHLERGWIGIGYNLVIYKDGTIHEGRPLNMCDADAYGYNDNSVSVAFVGDFDHEPMTIEQINVGINVLREIRKQYPKIKALRHKDVNTTNCPGANFKNQILFEGMKDLEIELDLDYKYCVDIVAGELGLNSAEQWYKAQQNPTEFMQWIKPEYVERMIRLMANKLIKINSY